MNIIFNELCQERVKYVHTTNKINSIHAIFYHILFLLLIYFNWNYFVMRSNTVRRAWVDLLLKSKLIVSCGCLYESTIYLYNIMFSIYYIASESNQVCLWLLYVLNTTKSRLLILSRSAAWQWAWRDDVCPALYRYYFCTNCTNTQCLLPRWMAKDVLLAGSFWLAALRLMDQSQEILLGHYVFFY